MGVATILPAEGTRPIGVDVAAFGLLMFAWLWGCIWVDADPARRRDTFVGGLIRNFHYGLIPVVMQLVYRLGWRD